jgi:hypothetical protein
MASHGVVSSGLPTPESFGFDNPETTPLSIPTNSDTPPSRAACRHCVSIVAIRVATDRLPPNRDRLSASVTASLVVIQVESAMVMAPGQW